MKLLYIFDFDGVLADSVDVKTQAFAQLYRQYGEDFVKQVVEYHKQNGGMSRFDKFRYYHQHLLKIPLDEGIMDALSKEFSELVVNKVVESSEILGVSDLLEYCEQQRIICAINSATPEDELHEIIELRGWNKYFQYIYGSPNSKFDNINKIIKNTKFSKSNAVFFGDSMNDYAAAKASGVDFIGINFHSEDNNGLQCFENFSDYQRLVLNKDGLL